MKTKRYENGYDITVECRSCHLFLYTHSELMIIGDWCDGTIKLAGGFCPVCNNPDLIATISNEYYVPDPLDDALNGLEA